ncbi:MAG: hypothetical protein ACFB00_01680 [Parvularculaceae bacterium]
MKTILLIAAAAILPATAFAQDAPDAARDAGEGARSRGLTKERFVAGAERRFDKADANGDGVWSLEEYSDLRLAEFDAGDRDGNGVISRGELRRLQSDDVSAGLSREDFESAFTTRFDKIAGGDGEATREEYIAASEAAFERADRNDDGRVVRGELRGLSPL